MRQGEVSCGQQFMIGRRGAAELAPKFANGRAARRDTVGCADVEKLTGAVTIIRNDGFRGAVKVPGDGGGGGRSPYPLNARVSRVGRLKRN